MYHYLPQPALLALVLLVVLIPALLIYNPFKSKLAHVPGPPNTNWIFGQLREIWKAENSVLHEHWSQIYGHVLKYHALIGTERLYTTDPKALNYILMSYDYQKPEQARWNLERIVGRGLLVVEGDEHKKQRKIMNPAFGAAQIRELTEIFLDKSIELRDLWETQCMHAGGRIRIDALSWLSRMTLDVIGLAGFDYKFNALNGTSNELHKAFATIFKSSTQGRLFAVMQSFIPVLRLFPPFSNRDASLLQARETMRRIGMQLLDETKSSLVASGEKGEDPRARDLLSLLIKANLASDLSQRMSDNDVLSQISTFLVAGHETTSTGTTWALFALTQDLGVQTKLRNELLSFYSDYPTMDELNSLVYLDYVVRETLRLHSPVPSTVRVATRDDFIPLSKPYTNTLGKLEQCIRVSKGQTVFVPILAMNRDKSIWGEDAMDFRPERWESLPEAVMSMPGAWGNVLSFLSGKRSCIGYRFSITEMKALLFVLVRRFEFELAVPAADLMKRSAIVQRPFVKTDREAGDQLPLWIRPYDGPK